MDLEYKQHILKKEQLPHSLHHMIMKGKKMYKRLRKFKRMKQTNKNKNSYLKVILQMDINMEQVDFTIRMVPISMHIGNTINLLVILQNILLKDINGEYSMSNSCRLTRVLISLRSSGKIDLNGLRNIPLKATVILQLNQMVIRVSLMKKD